MSKTRHYVCQDCEGKVSIPKGRRLALEAIKHNHESTCPSRRAKK